jgi:cell division protein ZapD
VTTDKIIFEQPLNENIRLCLRLEYLFQQLMYYMARESSWDSKMALTALLDILTVIDRPDLKNKLGQVLNQYAMVLAQFEQFPNVNKPRLKHTIEQLNNTFDNLHSNQGRVGQELRENEFLLAIQQRMSVPAGTCCFNLPSFNLWLQQPYKMRLKNLAAWFETFESLQNTIDIILKLTRESTSLLPKIAKAGFYQANLDPNIPYQMLRIEVPVDLKMYAEVSVGRHRLALHFFELNPQGKSAQTQQDVKFSVACCKLYLPNNQEEKKEKPVEIVDENAE